MFYADWFTERDHPLAQVWLASTLTKKLTRNQYIGANIAASIDFILDQQSPMALRLSSQLLLGVANIFKHKVEYLQNETQHALNRVRMAFAPRRQDATTLSNATRPDQKKSNAANTLEKSLSSTAGSLMPAFPFQLSDLPMNGLSSQTMGADYFDRRISIEVGRSTQEQLADNMGIDLHANDLDNDADAIEVNRSNAANATAEDHFDEPIDLGFDIQDIIGGDAANTSSDAVADQLQELELDVPSLDHSMDMASPLTPIEEFPDQPQTPRDEEAAQAPPPPKKRMIRMANVDSEIYMSDQDYQALQVEQPQLKVVEYAPTSASLTPYNFLNPQSIADLLKRKRDQEEEQLPEQELQQDQDQLQEQEQPASPLAEDLVANISVGDLAENTEYDLGNEHEQQTYENEPEPQGNISMLEPRLSSQRNHLVEDLVSLLPTDEDVVHFSQVSALQDKAKKANTFFELLVLATKDSIKVSQNIPYGDIAIQAKAGLFEVLA